VVWFVVLQLKHVQPARDRELVMNIHENNVGIGHGSASLQLLQHAQSKESHPQNRKPSHAMADILSTLTPSEDMKSQLEEQLETLRQAEDFSRNSVKDMGAERKAAAREKVEQIKAKLKMLRLLASVNPKAAARQAAQLAKELAAAVKEYAAAGGGGNLSGGGGVGSFDADAGTVSNVPTATDGGAGNAAGADAAAAGAAVPPTPDAASTSIPTENTQGKDAAKHSDDAEKTTTEEEDAAGDTATSDTQPQAALQAQVAAARQDAEDKRADTEFANEVKRIKAQLQNILETAKRKLQTSKNKDIHNQIMQGEKALKDVDDNLNDLNAQSTTRQDALLGATQAVALSTTLSAVSVPHVDVVV
jgi:hypothetical protein